MCESEATKSAELVTSDVRALDEFTVEELDRFFCCYRGLRKLEILDIDLDPRALASIGLVGELFSLLFAAFPELTNFFTLDLKKLHLLDTNIYPQVYLVQSSFISIWTVSLSTSSAFSRSSFETPSFAGR